VGRHRTVLLVTHDPRLAAIADRTVPVHPLRPRPPRAAVPQPWTTEEPDTDQFAAPVLSSDTDRVVVPVGSFDTGRG
jgi:hypothetical protein